MKYEPYRLNVIDFYVIQKKVLLILKGKHILTVQIKNFNERNKKKIFFFCKYIVYFLDSESHGCNRNLFSILINILK